MKDIKKMWMVTFDLNKYYVDVLYNKDSGKVTHYCNNGEKLCKRMFHSSVNCD